MTEKEKDAVREMMQTEGWKLFVSSLRERERALTENLIFCKPEDVLRGQVQIRAIREIGMMAKSLLEGVPNES